MLRADDYLRIKKSSKVKILHVLINKFILGVRVLVTSKTFHIWTQKYIFPQRTAR